MGAVFAAAELASVAAALGDAATAGRLWGAIEAEEEAAPVGQWPRCKADYETALQPTAGPRFERGRAEGRLLSLDEAARWSSSEPRPAP